MKYIYTNSSVTWKGYKYLSSIGILLITFFPGFAFSQSLYVSAGSNFIVTSGQLVSLDSLVLNPAANFNITGDNLLARNTTLTNTSANNSIKRSYNFSNGLPPFTGSITIYYPASELNSLDPNLLQLNAYTPGTGWHNYVSTVGSNFVTASGLNNLSFTELSLASSMSPLPIKWISISATNKNGFNTVQWTTADETNCRSFQVQKMTDAGSWLNTGTPLAAKNTSGTHQYSWTDQSMAMAVTYYRVLQADNDNRFSYSWVVMVSSTTPANIHFYPNPAKDFINISATSSSTLLKTIQVYSGDGKFQMSAIAASLLYYKLDISKLTGGNYILMIKLSNDMIIARTFVKQ